MSLCKMYACAVRAWRALTAWESKIRQFLCVSKKSKSFLRHETIQKHVWCQTDAETSTSRIENRLRQKEAPMNHKSEKRRRDMKRCEFLSNPASRMDVTQWQSWYMRATENDWWKPKMCGCNHTHGLMRNLNYCSSVFLCVLTSRQSETSDCSWLHGSQCITLINQLISQPLRGHCITVPTCWLNTHTHTRSHRHGDPARNHSSWIFAQSWPSKEARLHHNI